MIQSFHRPIYAGVLWLFLYYKLFAIFGIYVTQSPFTIIENTTAEVNLDEFTENQNPD